MVHNRMLLMDRFAQRILAFLRDETGATAIEFGLIIGFVSIAGIAAYGALGQSFVDLYTFIHGRVDDVALFLSSGGSSP